MNTLMRFLVPALVLASFPVVSLSYPFEQDLTEGEMEFVTMYIDLE